MGGVLSVSPLNTTMPFSTNDCLPFEPSLDLPAPVLTGATDFHRDTCAPTALNPLLRKGVR
ncbi:hypothetical protein PSP31121_01496 [Pandoraea sputorum]|uniref:Uncharacterized protein n=1 Tax=Pandoraea sputorum TaxID=93222 RepID=A0A5E5B090_9BURK|nr:hypothetical protein PSP31121_01496 [Pandoraea sputorum]